MKRTLMFAMLGLLGAAPAFAQSAPEAPPPVEAQAKAQRFDRLAGKLGLDAAQKAKVQLTFQKFRAQVSPLRQSARQTRQALAAELANAQPDEARVASLTAQLQSDRQQMMAAMQARSAELKSELTPTQYARLVLAKRHFGRGMHHHWRGGGAAESVSSTPGSRR